MTSAPAIGFEYRPSRWLPRSLLAMLGLAVLAVLLCGLPWWGKTLLLAAVIGYTLRRWQAAVTSTVRAANLAGDGGWSIRWLDGHDGVASLLGCRMLGPLIWLRLRAQAGVVFVLLLAPDNCDADVRRRLRIRLGQHAKVGARRDD